MTADAFENIFGQAQVREFLRAIVAGDKVSHAYLFTGPAGSNKTAAAYALAQSVVCKNGGCMTCDDCRRVVRRKHPDVRYFAPAGANGYLVEQIREIVSEAALAPIRAHKKVYLLDRVDLLGVQAANAFLKTLEEPPDDVVLILLGRTRESVLPTIVSRCQVVPFRHIPASEAAGILVQNTGATLAQAEIAIQACDGSITRAFDFVQSKERRVFRSRILEILAALFVADDLDILNYARELLLGTKAPLDTVRAAQEEELAASADFLAKSALRQIEARNKRALTAKSVESLNQLTAIIRSWLRDVMMVCAGTPELVINGDAVGQIEDAAARTDVSRAARALEAVHHTHEAITYNVSPETCIDVMLFEIREVLYGTDSTDRAAV
ncbi:MAG: DNA polymerase III subunit delta' [Raoultibacter sp.]